MNPGDGGSSATPAGRVIWLLDTRYGGSRSTMAKAAGVSLTGLIKVVTGQQTPGRRFLEAVAANTDVSPAWLLTGEGPPFRGAALPVAAECLSGPPAGSPGAFVEDRVADLDGVYSPTRYWLRLRAGEPAVRTGGTGLAAGDLLLMEADAARFPAADVLDGRWAVVPGRGRGQGVKLARLSYHPAGGRDDPAVLEAETFGHFPQEVRQVVVDELPGGELKAYRRTVYREPAPADEPDAGTRPWSGAILPQTVTREGLVAVCVLVLRRF